jgi:hypothetical protein
MRSSPYEVGVAVRPGEWQRRLEGTKSPSRLWTHGDLFTLGTKNRHVEAAGIEPLWQQIHNLLLAHDFAA